MRILALEVGTTSVKAAVLDADSAAPVGPMAQAALALERPAAEAVEVPAARLWTALASAAREAVCAFDGIDGIGLTCSAPALVLLDKADQPLLPIWLPQDRRARTAARQVWAAVGAEFLNTVGARPLPGGISVLSWRQMLVDDPYLVRRVHGYLHLNGWLGLHLTGERAFDPANASCSGLYHSVTDQRWSERWCVYFRVEPSWLPRVVCGSTTLGKLRAAAAADMGVPPGLPVKLGTVDVSSAVLYAGMEEGDVLHLADAGQTLASLTRTPHPSAKHLTRLLGVGAAHLHISRNPIGAAALGWLHHLCFHEQSARDFHERTLPAALARATRVTFDPPFLNGDFLEIEAHRAAFRDLTLATDRLDLLAALLDALRRRQRQALLDLGLGERFQRCFLTGGDAGLLRRLLPDAASAQVLEDAALRGVARLFRREGSVRA